MKGVETYQFEFFYTTNYITDKSGKVILEYFLYDEHFENYVDEIILDETLTNQLGFPTWIFKDGRVIKKGETLVKKNRYNAYETIDECRKVCDDTYDTTIEINPFDMDINFPKYTYKLVDELLLFLEVKDKNNYTFLEIVEKIKFPRQRDDYWFFYNFQSHLVAFMGEYFIKNYNGVKWFIKSFQNRKYIHYSPHLKYKDKIIEFSGEIQYRTLNEFPHNDYDIGLLDVYETIKDILERI